MKIACLFRGNLRQNDRTKDKFNEVIKSIYKLFDSKDIDFFMHLWGDESEYETYKDHFKKDNLLIENNSDYLTTINDVYLKYGINDINYFNQISQSISIKKVCDLLYSYGDTYDLIFITRPDLPFSEKLSKIDLNNESVYFNKHGEYCFILTQDNVILFNKMFDYLKENNIKPNIHRWIYDYISGSCNKKVLLLNIDVGVNCEIFKHLENYPYPNIHQKIKNFIN
jgi:hypothetical protein